MYRKPAFWIVLAALSLAAGAFSFALFPSAFPLVRLDLRMDRETAMEEARRLSERYGWGPEGSRQAASFVLDGRVRTFVELEAGGREAYARMLGDGLYSPYRWRVRQFREGETNECSVEFTPAGEPYGFVERLPEDEPGAALGTDAARDIAERAAGGEWDIDLGAFELVESSQEVRPGGRFDHRFVYERPDPRIGEGRYRLRLGVSGDRFTELTHFIEIPEAFDRRYVEMRSANSGITQVGSIAMLVLYVGGGCVIGLFVLLRKRRVLWRKPLLWGALIAFAQLLAAINRWPLLWIGYDTALSTASFAIRELVFMLLGSLAIGAVMTVSFMAAEGLTRLAFPEHIQFWRLWSTDVAASPAVLGRTVAGYLLVTIFMAYDVALYFLAHRRLGWWTPSDALFDPDILATYFPWLGSLAISLQAGFWEECLFRAVPLAGAALLGRRFGGRRYWLIAGFAVQALIFGAGHAAYATQPSYARVVELIIPSIVFGLIYLRFGLLSAIVLHFAFDVVWIAMPLFVAATPAIWVDRTLVVLLTLVPLWVVAIARVRRGAWVDVRDEDRNRGWSPAAAPPGATAAAPPRRQPGLGTATRRGLIALGLVGFVVWVLASRFDTDAPSLEVGSGSAVASARRALAAKGFVPDPPWREMRTVDAWVGDDDRFVWQNGGPETYDDLLGRYLAPPRWRIRYARFEGDVVDRAEEFHVWVDPGGEVVRMRHRLPEARPGKTLTDEDARRVALEVVREAYGLAPTDIEEVAAEPEKLPERTDWTIRFKHPGGLPLATGEARIAVRISGEEVTDAYRYVHVPEDWRREERSRRAIAGVIRTASGLGAAVLVVAGAVGAVVQWSRRRFSVKAFLTAGGIVSVLGAASLFNGWPASVASFRTAEPFLLQASLWAAFGLVGVGVLGAVVGLNVGLVHRWLPGGGPEPRRGEVAAGFALGTLAAGLAALVGRLLPDTAPRWGEYDRAAAALPAVASALDPLLATVVLTAGALLAFTAVDRLSVGWTRRRGLFVVLFLLAGVLVTAAEAESPRSWVGGGIALGVAFWLAYWRVLRLELALVPPAVAGMSALEFLEDSIRGAHPGARLGFAVAVVLVAALGYGWHRWLSRESSEPVRPEPSADGGVQAR